MSVTHESPRENVEPYTFNFPRFLIALVFLESALIAQGILSYRDQFLTVSAMHGRGIPYGLPFLWHFAMWSDLVLISPLVAYLVGRFCEEWARREVTMSFVVGFIVSSGLHWSYIHSSMPQAHVYDGHLTPAGIVHLIYMAIAIGIFLSFFLFTTSASANLMFSTSGLLILHVFVGTHMVLGIINILRPLGWYPDRPLRNIQGWITVTLVVVGFAFVGIRNPATRKRLIAVSTYPFTRGAVSLIEFWTLQRVTTTEQYLKALDYIAGYVGFTAFFTVFLAKIQAATTPQGSVFSVHRILWFVESAMLPTMLIFIFGVVYAFSRHSVRLELLIAPKLFPRDRVPKDYGDQRTRVIMFFLVIGFMFLYLSLTWYSDNILIASTVMFAIACNDWRTRYLIGDGIGRYFGDSRYTPFKSDPEYEIIMRRRAVADRFLFKKPHLFKESARVVGCALSCVLAVRWALFHETHYNLVAYGLLIVTLVLNEIFTMKWRFMMFQELKEML